MDVNDDILWLIAKKLDNNDWWSFRQTCRHFYYSVSEKDINIRIIKLLTERTKTIKRLSRCVTCHFCNDCCCKEFVECSICYGISHESCHGWDTKIDYCDITDCQNAVCSNCFKFCFSCNTTVCKKHLVSCPDCGRQTCVNCMKICTECQTEFCNECDHEFFCEACIKRVSVCEKIECHICEQHYCMPCTRLCVLCNTQVGSYDYDDYTNICIKCEEKCKWCLSCNSLNLSHKLRNCGNCTLKECDDCIQLCDKCDIYLCNGCYSSDGICDKCFDKGV